MSETVVEKTVETAEVKDPNGLLAAYNKAKEDLVALRNENKTLTEQIASFGDSPYKAQALAAETRLALQAQGIKDVDRLMPYIGTDALEFSEDGKVTGLVERMAQLKKDLPEVFDPKTRAAGKADIFANDNVEAKKDPFREAIHKAIT